MLCKPSMVEEHGMAVCKTGMVDEHGVIISGLIVRIKNNCCAHNGEVLFHYFGVSQLQINTEIGEDF